MEANRSRIHNSHKAFIKKMEGQPGLKNFRCAGVILAMELDLEMDRYGEMRNSLFQHFMSKGVFLRPLGNTIYVLPPYVTSDDSLQQIYAAITDCLLLFGRG